MQHFFRGKNILIGITGSIAAYKIPQLVDQFVQLGACVRVVLTKNARHFVAPLALQALGAQIVRDDLFDLEAERAMSHMQLAKWCDGIVIVPCSANTLSALSQGLANNLLTTTLLASRAPVAIVPAMNQAMWGATVIQAHVQKLKKRDVQIIGPVCGLQACGDEGEGRMTDIPTILLHLVGLFVPKILTGKKVVVSAGGTTEPIDPVRFITNRSSGKMGLAMANAAVNLGANVCLVTGHVWAGLPHIAHEQVCVKTAKQMQHVVQEKLIDADVFISAAAIADYRPTKVSHDKLKKQKDLWNIELTKNADVLSMMVKQFPNVLCVGFAAETDSSQALIKMKNKGLDMLVVNEVGHNQGFELDENTVNVLVKDKVIPLPKSSKFSLSHGIWQVLVKGV